MERYKLPDWHYKSIQQKKARIEEIKKEIEIIQRRDHGRNELHCMAYKES